MAEFRTQPYNPMDRQYHETIELDPARPHANIEEPIIPISQLGQTIPEHDPAGRFKNVIQVAQAAIRRGAGVMQLMLQTTPDQAVGGRPKGYGPEVREQLREVFKANEAILSGMEMPTAINNLSGYNPQQGTFDDERQKRDMDEVKDAIRFAADVAEGGGIDVLSWEYARPLFNASWNTKDKEGKPLFEETGEPIVQVVDQRTGRIQGMRINEIEKIPMAKDPKTGKDFVFIPQIGKFAPLDPKKGIPKDEDIKYLGDGKYAIIQEGKTVDCIDKLKPWKWEDFQKWADNEGVAPEQYFMKEQLQTQIKQARGWATTYREHAKGSYQRWMKAKELLEQAEKEGDTNKIIVAREEEFGWKKKYEQEVDTIGSYEQQAAENEEKAKYLVPIQDYALQRATKAYAELGIAARQETIYNKHAKRDIYVGPELGWPHAFGSHPSEFKQLIEKSREEMVNLMTNEKIPDPKDPTRWVDNPYYEKGLSRREAEETAKRHIKGCFDTSHVGMWLQHFKPELPWNKRVEEFNKWYMEEVKKLAKSDVVGSIQLVDSMSAAHGHLPPGQGIFPVVEAAKEFKKQGFTGFMVSEGHEEERFEEGRILVETWKAFNAPFESKYGPGMPARGFADVQNRYLQNSYSPRMMFGSYTPPFGEYKPWSELPFE